jgi:hypothetical protein
MELEKKGSLLVRTDVELDPVSNSACMMILADPFRKCSAAYSFHLCNMTTWL